MKKLILIALAIFSIQTFAQVQGCVWTAALDTTGETDYYQCRSAMDHFFITVALVDSGDTITVYSGTNLPDSTYNDEIFTRISLMDLDSNKVVDVITGDELTHTYRPLGDRRRILQLLSTGISDTTVYYIEGY